MKVSSRHRNVGGSFAARRGHTGQLSITDHTHHVTEAIGDMYGDEDGYTEGKQEVRPLSFVASPLSENADGSSYFDGYTIGGPRGGSARSPPLTNGTKSHTLPATLPSQRAGSDTGSMSPTNALRERSHTDTANAQFPLNDIDYESNPAAVQQELHNLQALRRMSMDVGAPADPDLPSFQGVSLMPSVAPTGDDDEHDPSRLFWVPARVHPELAPMEFKTFLENRVQSIKRRSTDMSSLSPEAVQRAGSGGGLRRKKSMLSRQIDNSGGRGAFGYKDGSEHLERKRSLSHRQLPEIKIADLQELDELVKDPSKAMQKLTLDTSLRNDPPAEVPVSEDMPILPSAPIGLRRSTRTTYGRGSLRRGERVPLSKRAAAGGKPSENDADDQASSPLAERPLIRVLSEPVTENFSRPNRSARRSPGSPQTSPTTGSFSERVANSELGTLHRVTSEPTQTKDQLQPGQNSRSNTNTPVPRIVETPPHPDEYATKSAVSSLYQEPDRPQSQGSMTSMTSVETTSTPEEPPARSNRRPGLNRNDSSSGPGLPQSRGQTLEEITQKPSPLPGNTGRTDALTFIPTLQEEKKPEKKLRKEEPDASGSKKPSWAWFKGSEERDKKDKKKEDESKEVKKGKTRIIIDKAHDSARLDVLQHSIDTAVTRGRESLLLDRDSIENKLQDERKKESSRKIGPDVKKEKDGIFSSIFGGAKKKSDPHLGGKKASSLRTLSPDPPRKQLKPDVDYAWTRFTILEERAIYRMAHIKLANPRRALYSQVLLSNFMYSYLAKVQQMHPHVQIPQSAQQKKQQELERKKKEQEKQKALELQQEQYRYDYHQGLADYAERGQGDDGQRHSAQSQGVAYVDDSQIYDYDHQSVDTNYGQGQKQSMMSGQYSSNHNTNHPNPNHYARQGQDYYSYGAQGGQEQDDDDEMW